MEQTKAIPRDLSWARRTSIRYKRIALFLTIFFLVGAYTSFVTSDVYALYLETLDQKSGAGSLYSQWLKFSCIVFCFLLTLQIGRDGHDRRDRTLLQAALGLTVLADFLIGILGKFEMGVAVFFLVQIAFITRHARGFKWNKKELISAALIYGGVAAIFFLLVLPLLSGAMLFAAPVYALALTTSVWIGIGTIWRKFYARTLDWFIAIGIVAFFMCDVNVGLAASLESMSAETAPAWTRYLMDFSTGRTSMDISNPSLLGQLFAAFIWYFYLPAQTLLSLSGYQLPFLRSIFPLIPVLPEPE